MNIAKGQQYKLVEFDRGFTIIGGSDTLGGRQGVYELIIADMPTILEYLVRYTENRAMGLGMKDSHQRALIGANVIAPGVLDLPDDLTVKQ